MWLDHGTSYASSALADHALATLTYALFIGPAQWWAFRQYKKAWWYVVASMAAQGLSALLDPVAQGLLFGLGFDSFTGTAVSLAGSGVVAFLTALPTGTALLRIARFNVPTLQSETVVAPR